MKETAIIAILCLGLTLPGGGEFPPAEVLGMARNLSQAGKERVARFARTTGVHFPDHELLYWDTFDGVYIVFWRRATGNRLPRPIDPFGPIVPAEPWN